MFFRLGLSGLEAAASNLEVTGNNVANSGTNGFKGSRAEFVDVFAVNGRAVSPTQIGNGVRLADVKQQFTQGNIHYTDHALDLALSGKGFFTVRDSNGYAYTRAGSFSTDRKGDVVNSQGQHIEVYPPLKGGGFDSSTLTDLHLAHSFSPPQATNIASVGVNLPSDASPPPNTQFKPSDPRSFNYSTSMTIYDSLGGTHTATMYFVKEAKDNSWTTRLYVDGKAMGTEKSVQFTSGGALKEPEDGKLNFPETDLGNGSEPIDLKLDFSKATQYGNEFATNALTQNGHATGQLSGLDIGSEGIVFARYTNGQASKLGQIALTNFANPNGLQQLGDTNWAETYVSGVAVRGTAGSSNFGLIQSGALEGSNVNVTEQLVNMIRAQRAFQANAKTISTGDQMTQVVMRIGR